MPKSISRLKILRWRFATRGDAHENTEYRLLVLFDVCMADKYCLVLFGDVRAGKIRRVNFRTRSLSEVLTRIATKF